MSIAPSCDAIVVIGSANSSNTRALEKLAIEAGAPRVFRVNQADELPDDQRLSVEALAHDLTALPDRFEASAEDTADVLLRFFEGGGTAAGAIEPEPDCDGDTPDTAPDDP